MFEKQPAILSMLDLDKPEHFGLTLCYSDGMRYRLNRKELKKAIFQIGVVSVTAGIVRGVFEEKADPETTLAMGILGVLLILLSTLEKKPCV